MYLCENIHYMSITIYAPRRFLSSTAGGASQGKTSGGKGAMASFDIKAAFKAEVNLISVGQKGEGRGRKVV